MPPKEKKEEKKGNVMNDLWFVLGIAALLITLWIMNGGPPRSSVKSFFTTSPIAPISSSTDTLPATQ